MFYIMTDWLPEFQNTVYICTLTDSSDLVCPQMICYPNYKTVKVSALLLLRILHNAKLMYIPDFQAVL